MLVVAPAKLTLSLRVTGVRPDGYHLIDAEMVAVDLADELTFTAGDALVVTGPAAAGVPDGPDNLVRLALTEIQRTAAVTLHKVIPAGAGLGGGSSDAAAVLRWAGCHDPAVAARVGADVAFCVVGGRARVTGVGEVVNPIEPEERTYTLVTPPVRVSTVEVYWCWDRMGGPTGPGTNDLEQPALSVAPELARWRDRLGDATGLTPRLAGSGSTWFVEGEFPGDGRVVVRTLPPHSANW